MTPSTKERSVRPLAAPWRVSVSLCVGAAVGDVIKGQLQRRFYRDLNADNMAPTHRSRNSTTLFPI